MGVTSIDGKLSLDLPDGMDVQSPDELAAAYGMEYKDMWGARDEARHVILTIIWKDSNEFLSKLASEKSLAKRTEKSLSKTYRKREYRFDGYFMAHVAGRQAQGFRYEFRDSSDALLECEVLVFKDGARCYTLYYYARADHAAECAPVRDAILSSLSIS